MADDGKLIAIKLIFMDKTTFFYQAPVSSMESSSSLEIHNLTHDVPLANSNKNLWDEAHRINMSREDIGYIEPNVISENFVPTDPFESYDEIDETVYDQNWPHPTDDGGKPVREIWHLGEKYAQLKPAWDDADGNKVIRIAHLDTGYDPDHKTCPLDAIERDLERNFVENNNCAKDIESEGWLKQPGHGSGTLSILAGNKINLIDYQYNDYLGIHKGIKLVPIRMSKSVVLWKNKAFVDAMEYIISLYDNPNTRCHVVTMSMGGLPLKAWADVVNRAYEKGIFIVTAAGNNFGRLSPSKLVYPARFNRVVAACGVNFDYSPYYRKFDISGLSKMQGNFGPRKLMGTSIAAFTPNVPWALIGTGNKVSIRGAGTSSATPQIAAAAALYHQKYHDQLMQLPEAWMRVEAIRKALFDTASKKIAEGYDNDVEIYFGNGVLQADKMLDIAPDIGTLHYTESDNVSWPFIKTLTGLELANEVTKEQVEMFGTEVLQLIQQSVTLQDIIGDKEISSSELDKNIQLEVYSYIETMPEASVSLKQFLENNFLRGEE